MEYANTIWDESAYKALVAELKSLAEPGYKAFQERLCTTSKAEILGVRSPYVKKIAKSRFYAFTLFEINAKIKQHGFASFRLVVRFRSS